MFLLLFLFFLPLGQTMSFPLNACYPQGVLSNRRNVLSRDYEYLMLSDSFFHAPPRSLPFSHSCSLRHCGVLAQLCVLTAGRSFFRELDVAYMVIGLFSSSLPSPLRILSSLEKSPKLFFS